MNTWFDRLKSTNWLVVLLFLVGGCSGGDRRVVLSDESGSRTLTYQYGKGFIPQAKVPDDVPVLVHSMRVVMSEGSKGEGFSDRTGVAKGGARAGFQDH